MKLTPLSTNVILRPDPEVTATPGGILLPDVVRSRDPGLVHTATVLAVGPGGWFKPDLPPGQTREEPWAWRRPTVKEGDRVLYALFTGTEVDGEGGQVVVIPEYGIVGVLA